MKRWRLPKSPKGWVALCLTMAPLIYAAALAFPTSDPGARSSPDADNVANQAQERSGAQQQGIVAILAALPVKGKAPKTGYDRSKMFGSAWTDDVDVQGGHNGCDTRNDVLRRDLRDVQLKKGTKGCKVLSGTLQDKYTGKSIPLGKDIQIEHIVALGNAWQTGAQLLPQDKRVELANDPMNLLAADASANQSKKDKDAAEWLPPNKAFRCEYVSRQIMVKEKYRLWITVAEKDAMGRVLAGCQ